jgi:enhancing lycopene biosynthesis protein 2
MRKKIAVILCGSGFKDGSEIRESVSTLIALDQSNAEVECFSLDLPQFDVVNCLTGMVSVGERRNMLVESARIARGKVRPLEELNPDDFNGLIIPGGFGVAKNLCDYASLGAKAQVNSTLEKILVGFYEKKKSIGAICIAPIVLALVFKNKGIKLTLGNDSSLEKTLESLGCIHLKCEANSFVWDENHNLVSTPAYMIENGKLSDIFLGIQGLVSKVLEI